jgi:hypothetical protein
MGSHVALAALSSIGLWVLVSSSLILLSFALAARGRSWRFWTGAIVAFKFFLCGAWGSVSVSAFIPSCRSHLHGS